MATNPNQLIPMDNSVTRRVRMLTGQDSPLMRQARGIGARTAGRRGLMNSSMAAGAAEGAAINAAIPIATQEAQQDYGREVSAAQIAAADRERVAAGILGAGSNYSNALAGTLGDPNVPAAARAAVQSSQSDVLQSQIDAIQRIYGVSVGWGGGPAGGAPPGVGVAPGAFGTPGGVQRQPGFINPAAATMAAAAPVSSKKKKGIGSQIAQTALSPVSTKMGRGLLGGGLASLFT